MAIINSRDLFPNDGLEHYQIKKSLGTNFRGVFDIPVGSGVLFLLGVASQNGPASIMLITVSSATEGHITQLGTTGTESNSLNPNVRLTTGGGVPSNHMRVSINMGSNIDACFQWTDLNDRHPVAYLSSSPTPTNGEVERNRLALGVTRAIDSTSFPREKGVEPFNPGNLPPIASPGQAADGVSNTIFLTPFSMATILKNIADDIAASGERVVWLDTGSNLTMQLRQINVLKASTNYTLPTANPGEWVLFTVHPSANLNTLRIKAAGNAEFTVYNQLFTEAKVDPKWVGKEIRAMVNKTGKWEILV